MNKVNPMNKPYQVEGDFQMGRARQHFVLQVAAASEKAAKDQVLASLGGRHGVNRREVSITSCKTIGADAVTDAATIVALRQK